MESGIIFTLLRTLYPLQYITPLNISVLLAKTYLMLRLLYGCEIFAYCDSTSKSRLTVAYNAILRYVYGIRRYDGICLHSKAVYGVELIDLLKMKALILLHKVIYTVFRQALLLIQYSFICKQYFFSVQTENINIFLTDGKQNSLLFQQHCFGREN